MGIKKKNKMKMVIDIVMSVALLFLMAFQVTGDKYHEWIGAGMLVLFLIHNTLNLTWYKAIFKGRYSGLRVLRTIVNIAVLVAIILTGYSGIVMSRYVFDFLPISGGMATARKLHLAGSYWAFVLMSIHLGMHWSMVVGKIAKRTTSTWPFRIAAIIAAVYGAMKFGQMKIFSNMFLQNDFAILDFDTPGALIILQNLCMMGMWVFAGHYLTRAIVEFGSEEKREENKDAGNRITRGIIVLTLILCGVFSVPWAESNNSWTGADNNNYMTEESPSVQEQMVTESTEQSIVNVSDGYIYITGGDFEMGSPDTEAWRSADETSHFVSVSDFYMSAYELTQEEYEAVTGSNPSTFTGDNLPVENISWLDAVAYCNARSEQEGLTPAYMIEGSNVSWNRGADGYRLPTEAEWEYACRAGTTTPFNTETSISAQESNYYGHYPYDIEENYFDQDNLTTQPGEYRETTIAVDSFEPNAWGLYNMHGNVSEWVWDYYGNYGEENLTNPTGPASGSLRVYRGGGWNDFAKNLRSAYRATLEEDMGSFNIGIRLVRNAVSGEEDMIGEATHKQDEEERTDMGKVLIAYFSWGSNTGGVAEEIQEQTCADLFEITLVNPYSDDYNTVLDQSQHDQNIQARPEIAEHIENMEEYDTILLGYPNWWASIPMPIASFLEEYDFADKTIIPFCSHGGGRFGQSLTAIAKLAPDAAMGEALQIHYSGGSEMPQDVEDWLRGNEIIE